MSLERIDVVHVAPVWRERADFILGARLQEGRSEQLWVRELGDQRFQVCCIPFFLFDIALGDIVSATADFDVERVVESSGRHVFRAWFGDTPHSRESVTSELTDLGALIEWSSDNLLAIDAEDEMRAQALAGYLADQQAEDRLVFETGRS